MRSSRVQDKDAWRSYYEVVTCTGSGGLRFHLSGSCDAEQKAWGHGCFFDPVLPNWEGDEVVQVAEFFWG